MNEVQRRYRIGNKLDIDQEAGKKENKEMTLDMGFEG